MITVPDNIWTPDSSDLYSLSIDLATSADSVQDALLRYRGLRVMTNAQRLALAGANLFNGLHVYTTDTDRYWIYRSGAWIDEGPRDTGWVSITPASGFSPLEGLAVRRIGNMVYLRGGVSKDSGTISNSGYETLFVLPAGFRINQYSRFIAPGFPSSNPSSLVVNVHTSGVVEAGWSGHTATTARLPGISFPVE